MTSRGGMSMRRIGVNPPEAEMIAVSSRRQRGHTKRTSLGDVDQLERLTLAAIGHASHCEHDTRNRPGSSIPIPCDSASCLLLPMIMSGESFRCPDTVNPSMPKGPAIPALKLLQTAGRSVRALERAGRGAGDRVAMVARLAGGHALVHVAGVVGAVVPHRAGCGRAGDVLLLIAGRRHERENEDRKQTHGIVHAALQRVPAFPLRAIANRDARSHQSQRMRAKC
ncbi:blr4768 [Bradyrhizobium diazoefficiens USDA 110]|uniref:Blr4768 protein n=1 Tax=Bradyrhizobium diazoefficiens (strain JCM 10833 / BCRC 13528 / IAM 13628 / NBRC 14792 / USDA 110) TaxID=224911 RepID=Q89KY0_BRADU|nr:hypothetical protein CO678_34650 [Bradyrhizobium diazoefficiens]QBP23547.1 hypothetical protein Bdiaspc4_25000 [Bradyrhizobium diazoefficiens]BAC50033.1 blr4768 [Bradyrhizobium diazoefficiens USDA 110]